MLFITAIAIQVWWLVAIAFVQGYAFAWVGHFIFEHNKPATFVYPWLSFLGDWCLWWEILTGTLATEEALKQFDTQGESIEIGGESLFLRKLLWASLPNKRQKLRDR